MKKQKSIIVSIIIILIALVAMVLQIAGVFNTWDEFGHPILTFFLVMCSLFGLYSYISFAKNKNVVNAFLGAGLISISVVLVFFHYDFWWIIFVIVPVVCVISALVSIYFNGEKTEEVSIKKDSNAVSNSEQKIEKAEEKELPKLKSFKD